MSAVTVEQRPLVAVSLKMYLSARATRSYVARVAELSREPGPGVGDDVEVALLPTFPLLESTAATLSNTEVTWGAQDVAPSSGGAQTGEVSAEVLRELGCRYVEIGHAERRRLFSEDDELIAGKLREAVAAGLVPLYCVGETERLEPTEAAGVCLDDVERALIAVDGAPLVVAYEPVWAIGAPRPAPAEHVRPVCQALRDRIRQANPASRVIYGGAAGPGTFTGLAGAVDGLFLGRFAHDPQALLDVVDEVGRHARPAPGHRSCA